MNTKSIMSILGKHCGLKQVQRPRLSATVKTSQTSWIVAVAVLLLAPSASAQWLTQSIDLKSGWNAVYLHVDVSHDTVENILLQPPNPDNLNIQEIWRWQPSVTLSQFIDSPQEPLETSSNWRSWKRSGAAGSPLQYLYGNAAYLIFSTANFTWTVKGRPLAPDYQWTTSGLNFIGFPTPEINPPDFDAFLSKAASLQQAEFIQYTAGEATTNDQMNLSRVFALRTTPVARGRAFWINLKNAYNRYYGPFEVVGMRAGGIDFAESRSTSSFRLKNATPQPLTVTMEFLPSENDPGNNPVAIPPLLLRGERNPENFTYEHTVIAAGTPHSWSLSAAGQPGSEVEVVVGLNRFALSGNPGDRFGGILRLTDSLGLSQVDASVAAALGSSAGLWVGNAAVTHIQNVQKTWLRDDAGDLVVSDINRTILTDFAQTSVDPAGAHAEIRPGCSVAQTFVADHSGPLVDVKLQLSKVAGTMLDDFLLELRRAPEGAPLSEALSTIAVPPSSVPSLALSGALETFTFTNAIPPSLIRGESYAIVIRIPVSGTGDGLYRWHLSEPSLGDVYEKGVALKDTGTGWSSLGTDLALNVSMGSLDIVQGQYLLSNVQTNLGAVARPFPLRLIVHNPEAVSGDRAVLLQRVFAGLDSNTNSVISTLEAFLDPSRIASARRISSIHLPWTPGNDGWDLGGVLGPASTLATTVVQEAGDQAGNPFLHTYHPDHDNLNARFDEAAPQGRESYKIKRVISLTVQSPPNDFESLTQSGRSYSGLYRERILLLGFGDTPGDDSSVRNRLEYDVLGGFILNQIADTPELTRVAAP